MSKSMSKSMLRSSVQGLRVGFNPFLTRLGRRLSYGLDLLYSLVQRDIQLMYKRSLLGLAWTLMNPVLQLIVFAFVFGNVLSVNIDNYASFACCGLLAWNWFQMALFQATGVITNNRALIRQPGFPPAILPIVVVTTGLVHFLLALPVLIVFLVIDGVPLTSAIWQLPGLLMLQFVLTIALAYPLAALNVAFRDTQHILGVLLNLLFYLTPVFYNLKTVPSQFLPAYQFNPMVYLVEGYRAVLVWGHEPNWGPLWILGAVTVLLLPIGHQIFRHQSDRFVEEL